MATNPWTKFSASPWALMVGSGSLGDDMEVYRGRAGTSKEGRTVRDFNRPHAVCRLKILMDHLVRTSPRLLQRNRLGLELIDNGPDHEIFLRSSGDNIDITRDFYFGSATANKVGTFQHTNGLAVDGIVGRGTMERLWELGRSNRRIRYGEWQIRTLMFEALWDKSKYDRADLAMSGG
ncbi:peptidoglycan-binding domain-containing protein [Elioraea rosea]|uniref:peptidoglycan-binding domain-containing protein n=1 Tax=Elioraea rosea TaxID=2492390 RepID=UPI001951B1F2|nr:peptidoglycan-binding protein [Elioraea rosea]